VPMWELMRVSAEHPNHDAAIDAHHFVESVREHQFALKTGGHIDEAEPPPKPKHTSKRLEAIKVDYAARGKEMRTLAQKLARVRKERDEYKKQCDHGFFKELFDMVNHSKRSEPTLEDLDDDGGDDDLDFKCEGGEADRSLNDAPPRSGRGSRREEAPAAPTAPLPGMAMVDGTFAGRIVTSEHELNILLPLDGELPLNLARQIFDYMAKSADRFKLAYKKKGARVATMRETFEKLAEHLATAEAADQPSASGETAQGADAQGKPQWGQPSRVRGSTDGSIRFEVVETEAHALQEAVKTEVVETEAHAQQAAVKTEVPRPGPDESTSKQSRAIFDPIFQGSWVSDQGNSHTISRGVCSNGSGSSSVAFSATNGKCHMEILGEHCLGTISSDGSNILWDDGDTWSRERSDPVAEVAAATPMGRQVQVEDDDPDEKGGPTVVHTLTTGSIDPGTETPVVVSHDVLDSSSSPKDSAKLSARFQDGVQTDQADEHRATVHRMTVSGPDTFAEASVIAHYDSLDDVAERRSKPAVMHRMTLSGTDVDAEALVIGHHDSLEKSNTPHVAGFELSPHLEDENAEDDYFPDLDGRRGSMAKGKRSSFESAYDALDSLPLDFAVSTVIPATAATVPEVEPALAHDTFQSAAFFHGPQVFVGDEIPSIPSNDC